MAEEKHMVLASYSGRGLRDGVKNSIFFYFKYVEVSREVFGASYFNRIYFKD